MYCSHKKENIYSHSCAASHLLTAAFKVQTHTCHAHNGPLWLSSLQELFSIFTCNGSLPVHGKISFKLKPFIHPGFFMPPRSWFVGCCLLIRASNANHVQSYFGTWLPIIISLMSGSTVLGHIHNIFREIQKMYSCRHNGKGILHLCITVVLWPHVHIMHNAAPWTELESYHIMRNVGSWTCI